MSWEKVLSPCVFLSTALSITSYSAHPSISGEEARRAWLVMGTTSESRFMEPYPVENQKSFDDHPFRPGSEEIQWTACDSSPHDEVDHGNSDTVWQCGVETSVGFRCLGFVDFGILLYRICHAVTTVRFSLIRSHSMVSVCLSVCLSAYLRPPGRRIRDGGVIITY